MAEHERLSALSQSFTEIGLRIDRLEQACAGNGAPNAIKVQFLQLDHRLSKLEALMGTGVKYVGADSSSSAPPLPEHESATYKQLHQDLVNRGARRFRFVRVAGPYYEESIEFRSKRLNAESTDHLCKTMVMENTRAPEHSSDPRQSKYFLVLVQYTAAIDAEKLKLYVHKIANEVGSLSKSKINMRMTSDDVAKELTGYGHNAVTPLCASTKLPIIMSDKIAQLSGMFFMGAGEVDLKVGMPASEFLEAYQDGPVFVVDCTTNT